MLLTGKRVRFILKFIFHVYSTVGEDGTPLAHNILIVFFNKYFQRSIGVVRIRFYNSLHVLCLLQNGIRELNQKVSHLPPPYYIIITAIKFCKGILLKRLFRFEYLL